MARWVPVWQPRTEFSIPDMIVRRAGRATADPTQTAPAALQGLRPAVRPGTKDIATACRTRGAPHASQPALRRRKPDSGASQREIGVAIGGSSKHLVRDEVWKERGARGGGEAHIGSLHRCGLQRKDLVARALGVAVEVDGDLDAVGRDAARYVRHRPRGDVQEMLRLGLDAPPPLRAVRGAHRVAENLHRPAENSSPQVEP
jgi:hypothetical protein